jgi:O-antigen/teichoic acid export membrane protein
MIKSILKNTVVYAVLPHVAKIFGLITLPLIMEYLSAKDFGVYASIIVFSTLLSFSKDLGLYNSFFVSYYKYNKNFKIVWNRLFGILTIWSILYSILVFLFLSYALIYILDVKENIYLILTSIILPILLFDNVIMISSILLRLQKNIIYTSIVYMISGLLTLFFNIFFIVFLKLGYLGFFLSLFISTFFIFICFLFKVVIQNRLYPVFDFNYSKLKSFLTVGLPMVPHNYSTYLISSSDKVIMNYHHFSINTVGEYSFGSTISNYFAPIDNAIGFVFYPYYIENISNNESVKNKKLILVSHILIFFITVSMAIWAKEIFSWITLNSEFRQSYIFFIFFIMAYNYRPFYMATTWHLIQQEKTKALMKISLAAGVISVSFNFILLPISNVIISSIIYFISFMYLGFINVFIEKDNLPLKLNYTFYLIIILLTTYSLYIISDFNYIYKCVFHLLIIIYLAVNYLKIKNI